jgi:hypothetical protein
MLEWFFYDECSYIMTKCHCYFGDKADGRGCVSKFGGNKIDLLCFEIMQIHFPHPKLTLELLTKSSQMINHQWCVLLCGPLCRKKNLQVLKLLNSTSLVMFKFNFQQDESAIFFVCLKHCMKLNTFLVKICYAFEIIPFVIRNFIFVSSHMSIEDYFFALWLKNLQNLNAYSYNLVLRICFITSALSHRKHILGYMLQHGSYSKVSLQNSQVFDVCQLWKFELVFDNI